MSTIRVNRHSQTDSNYSLEVGTQSTNQSRPGFGSATRKEWTLNSNGTNSVTLNSTYSPPSSNPTSGQSIIGLQAKASDPALKTYNGIPATRCKAVFTGSAVQNISGSTMNNRYDVETSYFTNTLDGLYISNSSWKQTFNGSNTTINNSNRGLPTTFTFPSRTLNVTGSGITMTTANQNQLTTGNNLGKVNVSVAFDGSSSETFTHSLTHTGTLVRTWEGDNHIIDGLDGDNDPDLQAAFSLSELSAMLRIGSADITSSFSTTEDSVNLKIADAVNMSMSSTMTLEVLYKSDIDETISSTTELLGSTDNLVRLDVENYNTAFSISINDKLITDTGSALNSVASDSIQGNAIYDIGGDYTWDTINAIAIAAEEKWEDKDSWDDWTDGVWDTALETWDEWDQNAWARSYNLISIVSHDIDQTLKVGGTATLTSSSSLSALAGLNEPAAASLSSAFTISPTASGVIDVSLAISGAFTPTLNDGVIYDQSSVIAITGAFTPVLTANAIFDQDFVASSIFTFSVEPTLRVGPYQFTMSALFNQTQEILRKVGPYQFVMPALASTLAVGRLFYQADPFNIIKVPAETRQVVIPQEDNITVIDAENRVNKVATNTRVHLVDQETRRFKLIVAPISNRFSTPKERAEA